MKKQDALKLVGKAKDLVPRQDLLAFMRAIMEARKDEAASRVEMAKVQAAREVALATISSKHQLYRMAFERIFDERRDAIQKHFEIIDKGIASDNQDLILGALKGLGQIVAASPFSDLKALAQALEGDGKVEI